MIFLKKIVSLLLLVGLLFVSFGNGVLASVDISDSGYYKEKVLEIQGGEKLIKKVDAFLEKNIQNEVLLRKLHSRIEILLKRDYPKNERSKLVINILKYIDANIEMFLSMHDKDIEKEGPNEIFKKYSQELSSQENNRINSKLIKVQKQMLNRGVESLEEIVGEFSEYMNYEERGDFSAKLNIDHTMVGKIKAQLELEDYVVRNSDFDAQLKTQMRALLDAAPRGQEAMKLELSGIIDFISKDQNFYILLQNLNITDEQGVGQIKDMLEKAKEIALANKYVHFEDKQGAEVMQILQSITPQNILAEGDIVLSKPFFRAYEKSGDKYFLVPTKYACDTAKRYANKFDPFNGSECSEGQYNDLLEDMAESGLTFYMEMGVDNTTFGFNASSIGKDIELLEGYVRFSEIRIEELFAKVRPVQDKFPGEGAEFSYKKNDHFNAMLYANKGRVDMKLTSKLDKNNRIEELLMKAKGDDDFSAEMTVKDNSIKGEYKLEEYNTVMLGKLTGLTKNDNTLSMLNIEHQIVESGNYSPFEMNTKFSYDDGDIAFSNMFESEGMKLDMMAHARWDERNKSLVDGNLDIAISQKDGSYDYNTYKHIYSGDFKEIFSTEMSLDDRGDIRGRTLVSDQNGILMEMNHNGRYQKDFLELNNSIELASLGFPFGNGETANGNFNIKIDVTDEKQDLYVLFDMLLDDKQVIEFEMKNDGIREYKNVEIETPATSKTILLEELLDIPEY